nr:hypothetical protein [Angustibacter aerolatus]
MRRLLAEPAAGLPRRRQPPRACTSGTSARTARCSSRRSAVTRRAQPTSLGRYLDDSQHQPARGLPGAQQPAADRPPRRRGGGPVTGLGLDVGIRVPLGRPLPEPGRVRRHLRGRRADRRRRARPPPHRPRRLHGARGDGLAHAAAVAVPGDLERRDPAPAGAGVAGRLARRAWRPAAPS